MPGPMARSGQLVRALMPHMIATSNSVGRAMGIEPMSPEWHSGILPLNDARNGH